MKEKYKTECKARIDGNELDQKREKVTEKWQQ